MDRNNQSTGLTLHKVLTNINNKIVTQVNTQNLHYETGINIYEIRSKRKYFPFNAGTTNTASNPQIGSIGNTQLFFSNSYGLANGKTWYASISGGQTGVLGFTYITTDNASEFSSAITLPALNTWYPLRTLDDVIITNIISINDWNFSKSFGTTDILYISGATGNRGYSTSGGNLLNKYNSIFTCPLNAIAWVNSVSFQSQVADTLRLFKWNTSGIRSILHCFPSSTSFNLVAPEYGFGGYIENGESIGWGGEVSSTSRTVNSSVTVYYLY
jgi:hypothetical protein